MKSAASFARRKDIFEPQQKILVVCEDSKSCKKYLEDAKFHFRAHAAIEVIHCGKTNPFGIVEYAKTKTKAFDKIFCVLDRDSHPRWEESLQIAKDCQVSVVASYPCYEYWLLLHFKYSRRNYVAEGDKSPGDLLNRDLRSIPEMSKYAKGQSEKLFEKLLDKLPTAVKNAKRSLAEAMSAENALNPSTQLHLLLGEFEALSQITLSKQEP